MANRGIATCAMTAACAAAAWGPACAHAGVCGVFYADDGDNVLILGEETSYFIYMGQPCYYYGGDGGGDYCKGGNDGATYDWAHTSCETRINASSTGTDWGDCDADRDHNNAWWF